MNWAEVAENVALMLVIAYATFILGYSLWWWLFFIAVSNKQRSKP